MARWEVGVDVNGRAGLRALDIFERYTLAGALTTTENVSIDSARRIDRAVYTSVTAVVAPTITLAGGVRGDYITTQNRGGYFGDRDTSHGAASGYVSATAGSLWFVLCHVLLFTGWSGTRESGGVSAAFILVNSASGLAGNIASVGMLPRGIWLWAGIVTVGGAIGSELGSRRVGRDVPPPARRGPCHCGVEAIASPLMWLGPAVYGRVVVPLEDVALTKRTSP